MGDAHIPNSQATPGWKDHPFKRTSFLQSIQTSPIDGSDGTRYAGVVPVDWCIIVAKKEGDNNSPALGGYLCGALIAAARQFSRSKFPHRTAHDPLSIHVEFFKTVPQGPFQVAVKLLQAGRSQATIQAQIVPSDGSQDSPCCHAVVRIGNLKEGNTSAKFVPTESLLPDRNTDCSRWVNAFLFYVNPPTGHVRYYTPSDGPSSLWSPAFGGRNMRYQWTKLDDDTKYELEHVPLLVDLIPALPLNYEPAGLKAAVKYQIPSLSMNIDFCSDFRGEEWLLTRTCMRWQKNSRFDENIEFFNDAGQIVATCKHSRGWYAARTQEHAEKHKSQL